MLTFRVFGTPAPKGSTKAFMRKGARFPIVTDDNPRTRPWAALVKDAAQQAAGATITYPRGVPVHVGITFTLERPLSLPKKVTQHTKKPDIDKLTRAVFDALTGVVWQDDSQVVNVTCHKRYTSHGDRPGIAVSIAPWDAA